MDFAIALEAPGEWQFLRPLPGGLYLDLFRQRTVPGRHIISWGSTEPAAVNPFGALEAARRMRIANPTIRKGPRTTPKAEAGREIEARAIVHQIARGFPAYGYEESLPIMRSLRESASVRSVYLCFVFGMLSANEAAKDTERQIAALGPFLMSKLDTGQAPYLSAEEIETYWIGPGKGQRPGFVNAMWPAIPRIHSLIASGHADRRLRTRVAMEPPGFPPGTAMTKGSFALECLGHNVACLDRWMVRWLLGAYRAGVGAKKRTRLYQETERMMQRWVRRKEKDGTLRDSALKDYEKWENKLKKSPHYDPDDPLNLARAHWQLWEDIKGEVSPHTPLFRLV